MPGLPDLAGLHPVAHQTLTVDEKPPFNFDQESEMRVWVNSADEGWVMHGKDRISHDRAEEVAGMAHRKLGWQTASGPFPPVARRPLANAPLAEVVRKSPAW